jgi:hypothetical protein
VYFFGTQNVGWVTEAYCKPFYDNLHLVVLVPDSSLCIVFLAMLCFASGFPCMCTCMRRGLVNMCESGVLHAGIAALLEHVCRKDP